MTPLAVAVRLNPTVKELRVYVPAKDFELSERFYSALDFDVAEAWGGIVDCRHGRTLFRLQNYYIEDRAINFKLQFTIDDAQFWYDLVKPIIDSGEFAPARVTSLNRTTAP